ncbi:PREDICTED: deleted in azoospermia-like [Nanorana parkeri]|uniref:deleted in azoospermia-like n=1 Tax=Nanorana parkeri TaxID=125878 RepID=UPI0008542E14|nr:PREDICTED: deleted in azoospermia-like [Nanorana parkeri]
MVRHPLPLPPSMVFGLPCSSGGPGTKASYFRMESGEQNRKLTFSGLLRVNSESETGSPMEDQPSGYVLPEGKVMPNTVFVGGIDIRIDHHEIKDFFSKFGAVKEVKIITDRTGVSKGYGFVSFYDDIDVQKILDSQISFHGKKLKLGPAIRKQSTCTHLQPRTVMLSTPAPQYQSMWNTPVTDAYVQPTPMFSPIAPYVQTCPYPNSPVMLQQIPMTYQQPGYFQVAPQWAGGDQRSYVFPQAFNWNFTGNDLETACCEMLQADYTISEQNASLGSTSPQKKIDRSIQTAVSCLFSGDGRFQKPFFQDDFLKNRRVHQFKRRSMFRSTLEKSGV